MTSRVPVLPEKGGPLFRPVPKSRARTAPSASRQPSIAIDLSREESAHAPTISFGLPLSVLTTNSSAAPPVLDNALSPDPQSIALAPNARATNPDVGDAPTPDLEISYLPTGRSVPPIIGSSATPIRPPSLTFVGPRQNLQNAIVTDANRVVKVPPTVTERGLSSSIDQGEGLRPPTALANSNTITGVPETQERREVLTQKGSSSRRKSQDENSKGKKRRRGSRADDDDENIQDENPSKQSRASSSTPRPRKRAPSPPPYDPDADPGEDIDPTTVTMAALCDDTGQGRVSRKAAEILSNHAVWKMKNREKRARIKALMEAKKYGREDEESEKDQEDAQNHSEPSANVNEPGPSTASEVAATLDETGSGFDYSQDLATSRYNVQIRIGPNGETVIDEESLVVDRVENDGTDDYTHVVESDHTKFVNSGTYGKRYRGSRWSAEETELFYEALSQYGENYELIAYVLPGRDRKSCKNKFKVEDKRNHARINYCLNNSIPVDMKTLSRMTGKDFSGPVPEIRAPPSMPVVPPSEELPTETNSILSTSHTIKRSRSKSQGVTESGVVIIGDAENFEP
ncbi:hypothetical protein M413DRAFT_22382 [Hebeloma cylindrosporum]|uniref:Uncharacterized protein n=1 Tax=Hebeloma cylindrosporum TaxID=76867 RepID=A0A0C3CVA5_HEBCY|nr:hypothetical protein M413DRAFT_22382 [Hebeloma cylindrosporum h7]